MMLAQNVMHFARLLRRTGLRVGPAETVAAAEALTFIDLSSRAEVHAVLRAVMIHNAEDLPLFDEAFELFWRAPEAETAATAMGPLAPMPPGGRRLAEAMAGNGPSQQAQVKEEKPDAADSFAATERLQRMDFEAMGGAEIAAAKAEIRKLSLPLDELRTRRWRPAATGRNVDLAATIRASLRTGGEIVGLEKRKNQTRPPPLVVLCDISGSMSRYAQILLHFLHSVANDRDRVSIFLFGTRLSNVTRQLKHRDPEVAFQMVSKLVPDWSGGTRIGETLEEFNRLWARRVLGQGAVVLLVTDGLDRSGAAGLDEAMARLHRSCRRLIWLNPLLRWDGFAPKAQGVRAMLPHVDEFRPVHNLESSEDADCQPLGTGRGAQYGVNCMEGPAMTDAESVLETAAAWARDGEEVALATVTETWGSSPRPAGSRMAVTKSGKMAGSVSGGCIEGAVADAAMLALQSGQPALLDFGVTNEMAWEVGLACGGKVKVFVETLS